MKKPFKKLTAWLCCMAMLISFIPATALPVFAEEGETETPEIVDIVVTQTQGELEPLGENERFVLTGDLTLDGDLTVPTCIHVESEVTVDLAGNDIIAGETADGGIFAVTAADAHLTITDSVGGGKLISGTSNGTPALNIQAGTATLEEGEITGWNRSGAGGMVFVNSGDAATFNMAGGKLTGASANYGAAIRAEGGTVNMTGGEISGNTATDRAVIRLADGAVMNMSGGEIKDNTAANYAGAIRVCAGAEFNMTGGTISNNTATAKQGGALYVEGTATMGGDAVITGNKAVTTGGVYVAKNGSFTMTGGTISDNVATGDGDNSGGGGIGTAAAVCTVTISGGTITGNTAARGDAINMGAGGQSTLNISGGTIESTSEDSYAGIYSHTGTVNISGGDISRVYWRYGTVNVNGGTIGALRAGANTTTPHYMYITGNPVIGSLTLDSGYDQDIGNELSITELTEGATITLASANYSTYITTDNTSDYASKVYTYNGVGADDFVDGKIVMTKDDVFDAGFTVPAGEYILDLAGHTLTGASAPFITIPADAKLTIEDSVGGGKIVGIQNAEAPMLVISGGALTLEKGTLTGHYNASTGTPYGGAVGMSRAGSKFTMNGGAITGNTGWRGGAVAATDSASEGSVITINGGEISGNTAWRGSGSGDNIYTQSGPTLNINGGTINAGFWLRNTTVAITGAPTVTGLNVTAANCTLSITELTKGAYIEVSTIPEPTTDDTVAVDGKVYTYNNPNPTYAVTVGTVANGTVTVAPVAGEVGDTVTVTATADEGYELTAILVNGEAIEGNTFAIVAGDNVVTATFKAVAVALPTAKSVASGEYTLAEDHVLTGTLSFVNGVDVVIDLAGNTISMVDGTSVGFFSIDATSKLTIKDSVGGGKVQFKEMTGSGGISNRGTFVLEGGELNGWSRVEDGVRKAGGFIDLWTDATFKMTGGKITGVSASGNAVIRSQGTDVGGITVEIIGGEITGNDSGSDIINVKGTAENLSYLIIGGDAVIDGNTQNGAEYTKEEICGTYTHITVSGTPVVGDLYAGSAAADGVTDYGSITVTGAPTVNNISASTTSRTPLVIKELTDGAAIKTAVALSLADGNIDDTVLRTGPDAEDGNKYTYAYKAPAHSVIVIDPLGGTVSVDKTEAAEGETVTVTATADEGYELAAILVNGEAIQGTTFEMPAADVQVTATFTEVEPEGFPTKDTIPAGTYVLAENVTLAGTLSVAADTDVVVDLAGCSIYAPAGKNGVFTVFGNLTVKDSVGGGKIVADGAEGADDGSPAVSVQSGTFTLEGGEITGWERSKYNDEGTLTYGAGGTVFLGENTTFNMKGGKITGAKGGYGSAIRVNKAGAVVNMTGGEISGNTAAASYGPIYLYTGSAFNMTGGTITNNTGVAGGAIGMYGAAEVTISGGEITNNKATTGGVINNKGTVTITGGTFTGNIATGHGGVVFVEDSTVTTITGGTFTGNSAARGGVLSSGEAGTRAVEKAPSVTVGGTAVIEKNTCASDGYGGNLYGYTMNLTIDGGTIGTAFTGEADGGKGSRNNWVRNNDGFTVAINGGDIYGIQVTGGVTNVSGNPVITEIHATMTMSNLTTGAKIRTAGTGMVTVAEGDDTVYTTNDRDYLCKQDLGFADQFKPGETVKLEKDDSVGAGVTLSAAGEYTLDLNGFTLTGNAAPYFTVGAGTKLTVIDSSAEQTGKIVGLTDATSAMIYVNGEFVLAGGTLTGHTNTDTNLRAGAVMLGKNAKMTMTGGEISDNTAYRGGGISSSDVSGSNVTLTLSGGVIKDNVSVNGSGANIYVFAPAMVTIEKDIVIGAAYDVVEGEKVLATAPAHNVNLRSGYATITGGNVKMLALQNTGGEQKDESGALITPPSAELTGIVATITGNPVIETLSANSTAYATIGGLTSGAYVYADTTNPLTVVDDSVNVQGGRTYQCAADLTSILIIGNSFGGDTIQYLTKLGKFYGKGMDAANMYIGSQNFRWHAMSLAESLGNEDLNGDGTIGDSRYGKYDGYATDADGKERYQEGLYSVNGFEGYKTFPEVLDTANGGKKWDYVVLQQGVEYVGFEGTYNSDVQFLIDYIRTVQPEAEIYFNQTWAVDSLDNSKHYLTQFGGDQKAMYNAILANTEEFFLADGARFGNDVVGYFPIGTAIQEMRDVYTDTRLTRDGYHLSLNAGRMIAGLTVMKTLFGDAIDLDALTADDVAAMFDKEVGTETTSSADAFQPTEENVAKMVASVEAACGYAAAGTVAEGYADAAKTANKQFNPDAAMLGTNEFVAVYEGLTELGQLPEFGNGKKADGTTATVVTDTFGTAGTGKIVIYKDGVEVFELDEQWLDEQVAEIDLTGRVDKINAGEQYYIMADPQAPQVAVYNNTLYMTFDVKLYAEKFGTEKCVVVNGGVYLTTSTDGVNWTAPVKVSDAPMGYGLAAVSDGLIMSVVDDVNTYVLKLDAAGEPAEPVVLQNAPADVAFAEVGDNVYALASNGVLYVSADKGANWTAIKSDIGDIASPDMVPIGTKGAYVTWADEAGLDIYYKIWTIVDNADYGWSYSDAHVIAEDYAPATAYNGKSNGGQPASMLLANSNNSVKYFQTVYVDNGQLERTEDRGVAYQTNSSMALESSLTFNMWLPLSVADQLGTTSAKILRTYSWDDKNGVTREPVWTTVEGIAQYIDGNAYKIPYEGIAAKEMGDKLYMAAFDGEGNQVSVLHGYSAKEFAYKTLRGSNVTEKLSRLLVDMLNYGAAAQANFKYNVANPVNADLTEAEKVLASELVTIDESLAEGVGVATGVKTQVTVSTATVIELNVKYAVNGDLAEQVTNAAYATIDYTNHNGKSVTSFEIDLAGDTGKPREVKISALAAADGRTLVTVRLHNADGSEIVGSERTASIAGFVHSSLKNGYDATNAEQAIIMSLMQYSDSAYNYFHN